jgi:hypothetical protein
MFKIVILQFLFQIIIIILPLSHNGLATKTGARMARRRRRAVLNCVACAVLIHTFVSAAERVTVRRPRGMHRICHTIVLNVKHSDVYVARIFTAANVPWLAHVVKKSLQLFLRPNAYLTSTLLGNRVGANDCKCSREQQLNVLSEARRNSR